MKTTVGALTLFVADKQQAKEFYARAFELEFANHHLPEIPGLIERLSTHGG